GRPVGAIAEDVGRGEQMNCRVPMEVGYSRLQAIEQRENSKGRNGSGLFPFAFFLRCRKGDTTSRLPPRGVFSGLRKKPEWAVRRGSVTGWFRRAFDKGGKTSGFGWFEVNAKRPRARTRTAHFLWTDTW